MNVHCQSSVDWLPDSIFIPGKHNMDMVTNTKHKHHICALMDCLHIQQVPLGELGDEVILSNFSGISAKFRQLKLVDYICYQ